MKDNKKSKKFDYLKALGDYNLTNAEKATLTAMWNHADANTGYLWANLTHINEWCSRSAKSGDTGKHIKKAEELGLLTIGGHGRSRNYTLNLNIKPLPKSASKSAENAKSAGSKSASNATKSAVSDNQVCDDRNPSLRLPQTNRSSNKPSNTSKEHTIKEESVKKTNLLKGEVEKAKHYNSLDWKPGAPLSNHFTDEVKEAEMRFFYLISKGLEDDQTFGEVRNWFVEWVRDYKDDVSLTTWCFLNFNNRVSDLTAYQYYAKKQKTYALYKDYEVRAGFVPGKEHWSAVVPEISKRLVARGKEVVLL